MTNLELVTEAIYDALANHHRINWSQAEVAARAAVSAQAAAEARIATLRGALELARRALVTGLASYEQPLLLGRFHTEATSAITAVRTTGAARS